jgi:hypothetical protein
MTVSSERLSENQLRSQLQQALKKVEVGALYAHYRDPHNPYKVLGLALLEDSQEVAVIYQKEHEPNTLTTLPWIRPLSSWLENVDFEGTQVPRFQKKTA